MKIISCLFLLVSSLFLPISPSAADENLEKVSIQLDWVYQYQYAGFIAAKEKGYYADAGLDVELREYQPGSNTIASVMSQEANYGINNSSIVIDNAGVVPVALLATYLQQSPLVFVCSPDIKHPRDFIGKRIMGTTDELLHSSLALLLAHFTINKDNSHITEHSFKIDDFAEHKVDVMSAFRSNQLYELDKRHIPYNIIDPADYGFYMSAVNLFSSKDEALKFSERTKKLIEASNRGWQYAVEHTDEIVELIYSKYSQRKSKEALAFEANSIHEMMLLDFYPIGQANVELSQRTLKQLKQNKLIETDESLGTFLFDDLIRGDSREIFWTPLERQYMKAKKKITMCVDPDWMPFEKIDENGQHIGVAADILEMVQRRSGITLEALLTKSWTESLEFGKARKCDIFSLVMETPERTKYMDFTKPYISFPFVIATRTDELFVERLADVLDKPLAMVKGYAYVEILKDRYPEINLIEVDNMLAGLKMLRNGEVYGFIDTLATIAYTIQKEGMVDIKISGKFNDSWQLAIGTRNDEPVLHSIMQKALTTVSEKEKRDVYNNWFSVRFERGIDYRLVYKLLAGVLTLAIFTMFYLRSIRKYARRVYSMNTLLEQRNVELEKSLEEIKTLRGIIPICSSCKKIRDDQGYWNQIESYIQKHSEAEFSHGICQECLDKLYPDFADDEEESK